MPREYTYRDRTYLVEPRPEFRFNRATPWCMRVNGGWYQLDLRSDRMTDQAAGDFMRARLRNVSPPEPPALVASKAYPLLVKVDRTVVRAWPAFIPRGRGAATYVNPATGIRVAATRGPMWMLESQGRPAEACGSATAEQTIKDVQDLAALWVKLPLRTP